MIWRFWSSALVRHLEEEILWLRLEKQKESQRANIAVAELVRLQTAGQANVHPRPLMAEKEAAVEQEIADLLANTEFSQAGS